MLRNPYVYNNDVTAFNASDNIKVAYSDSYACNDVTVFNASDAIMMTYYDNYACNDVKLHSMHLMSLRWHIMTIMHVMM